MYTEEELLKIFREDSERGTRLLMEQYASLLHRVCSEKLQNKEDVDECVNDVFTEFFLKMDCYDSSKGSLKNYLCTIAERRAIDRYRKNCQKEKIEQEVLQKYQAEIVAQDDSLRRKDKLDEAMRQLPESDRKILQMHYYDGLSYGEIAEELDMKYETVKKRGLRGKQKLLYLILLGLLLFGITACTTIVMKTQHILPEWIPFYEWIPTLPNSEETVEKEEETTRKPTKHPKEQIVVEETETTEDEKEEKDADLRKYQYIDGYGFLWSGQPTYGLSQGSGSSAGEEKNNMRVSLEKAMLSDGKLSVGVRVVQLDGSFLDSDSWDQWKVSLVTADGERLPLQNETYRRDGDGVLCTFTADWEQLNLELDKIQGELMIEMNEESEPLVLKMEMSKLEVKEEPKSDIVEASYGGVKLKMGPIVFGEVFSNVSLLQEAVGDYKITNLIGNSYYGLPGKNIQYPYLTDDMGKEYTMMRISAKDMIEEEGVARSFEIYYRGIGEGDYTLHIPYLCLEGNTETDVVELALPTGENDYQAYDETILFPNGEGFHLKGLTRKEKTEQYYEVSADGTLKIVDVHYWYYEMEYDPISGEGLEFYNARSRGKSSSGEDVILVTEQKPTGGEMLSFQIQCDEMPTSMQVQFYSPTYVLEESFSFDITISSAAQ